MKISGRETTWITCLPAKCSTCARDGNNTYVIIKLKLTHSYKNTIKQSTHLPSLVSKQGRCWWPGQVGSRCPTPTPRSWLTEPDCAPGQRPDPRPEPLLEDKPRRPPQWSGTAPKLKKFIDIVKFTEIHTEETKRRTEIWNANFSTLDYRNEGKDGGSEGRKK